MGRRKSWVWWCVGVGAVIAGGYFSYRGLDVVKASDQLEVQRALARKEGLPMDLAAFHPKPIPADKDATPYWVDAVRRYDAAFPSRSKPPTQLGSNALWASSTDIADLESDLKALAPALKSLDRALTRGQLAIDRDFETFPSLEYPDSPAISALANLLSDRAVLRVRREDRAGALEDLRRVAKMANLLRDDPTTEIAVLLRNRVESACLRGLKYILTKTLPSRQDLLDANALLNGLEPLPGLHQAMRFEFASATNWIDWVMPRFDEIQATDGPAVEYGIHEWAMKFPAVQRANAAHIIEYCRQIYESTPADETDYTEAIRRWEPIDASRERMTGFGYELAQVGLAHWPRLLQRMKMLREMYSESLKILAVRLDTGKWPLTMPAGDALSSDAFGTQRLIYRPNSKGFVLYRPELDGKDLGVPPKYSHFFSFPATPPKRTPPSVPGLPE